MSKSLSSSEIIELEILEAINPIQVRIDKLEKAAEKKGIDKKRLCKAILYGSNDRLENDPMVKELRELRTEAFVVITAKMKEFSERGLLTNLPDLDAKKKEPSKEQRGVDLDENKKLVKENKPQHGLDTNCRNMKLDFPDLLVTGLSIWLFPMKAGEKLDLHDHCVNVASCIHSGTIRERVLFRPNPEMQVLELISDKPREVGDVNYLTPGRDIHTLEAITDGASFHIVGFSPNHKVMPRGHPIKSIYQSDDRHIDWGLPLEEVKVRALPPGANYMVGIWDEMARDHEGRITAVRHVDNGFPNAGDRGML